MMFFIYQISGDKTLASYTDSTWYVLKVSLGLFIFAVALGLLNLELSSEYPVQENIGLQVLTALFDFIFVGFFEELTFRALINDAIVYRFRDKKWVFVLSAACCSLLFGAAHVLGADLSSPMALLQAAFKTMSSGVFGLSLLILYWKTRNIWAVGLVHGIYDFILDIASMVFVRPESSGYVMPDEATKLVVFVHGVDTLIELVILFFIWLKVGRKIDYQEMRETW